MLYDVSRNNFSKILIPPLFFLWVASPLANEGKGSSKDKEVKSISTSPDKKSDAASQTKKKDIAKVLLTASLDIPATWLVDKAYRTKNLNNKYDTFNKSIESLDKLLYVTEEGKLLIKSYDVDWLIDQLTYEASDNATVNKRYLFERTFIYDLSIALMAYTSAYYVNKNDPHLKKTADALAKSLVSYVDSKGNAFMVISTDGTPEGDQFSGNSAWVATALAYYSRLMKNPETLAKSELIIKQLETLKTEIYTNGNTYELVKGGTNYDWISTEHNIDYYFLIKELVTSKNSIDPNDEHIEKLHLQRESVLELLWNPTLETFNRGYKDTKMALDCSSYGAMFLISVKEREMAVDAFEFTEKFRKASITYPEIIGYSSTLEHQSLWLEGTVTVAMAALKLKRYKTYKMIKGEIDQLREVIGYEYPLLYSTKNEKDMRSLPSTAATAWNLILESMALSRYIEKHFMH